MIIRLVTRLRGLLRRSRAAAELDEELQFHLEHEMAANVARGMSPGDARRAALRDLGGLAQTREAVLEIRSLWIDGVWRDARHTVRALIAAPSFSVVVVTVLTLSVAASASVFSIVDAVVLRPLPYAHPDRLVGISEPTRQSLWPIGRDLLVSPQEFFDWRERQDVFAGLAASAWTEITVKAAGEDFPERLPARWVTANYFDVLGRMPLLGRPFTVENEVPGRQLVALISHRLWLRRFGGDRNVIGKQLPGQLAAFDIVGVMPPDFRDPDDTAEAVQVWIPFVPPPDSRVRGNEFGYYLRAVARLRDGVSIDHAQSRMNGIMTELAIEHPRWVAGRVARVESLHASVTRGVRSWMLMLLGSVGCVLLIATVNLANLMLARGWARRQELAVRAALGASRAALARVLMVEGLVLSTTGATLGAAVAWMSVGYLRSSLPSDLPRAADVAIDARVLAVTMGVSGARCHTARRGRAVRHEFRPCHEHRARTRLPQRPRAAPASAGPPNRCQSWPGATAPCARARPRDSWRRGGGTGRQRLALARRPSDRGLLDSRRRRRWRYCTEPGVAGLLSRAADTRAGRPRILRC